ncbi:hypothetical protein K435DRAFT_714914 [Dendrothele bispora CBS 962.96]|uniref:DUF7598 domain-containing protein n=1 Tax=Dendrothele bispora (strain CBS 962.96) TaxID=1314807 RepID=A0A4S8MM18_DENBC|nr:hypothetical protein K435DRAFT_714914 [Dendrothele bispora CBS 962.96]
MSPRSYTFIGLNIVRALSIIGLILVFSSSILVMVTNIRAVNAFQAAVQNGNSTEQDFLENCDYIDGSNVPNQAAGVFWAVVSTLLIIFQAIILLFSECSWPLAFFDRFFPVLGNNFGLGPLGIFQCLIGAQILSHHVDDFTLVAAFFLFSIGCLNMLLGLIFRESAKEKRSVRAWREGGKGVFDTFSGSKDAKPVFVNASPAFVKSNMTGSDSVDTEKGVPASEFGYWNNDMKRSSSGYGFGRQGEKKAGLKGFILQKPEESLPRYASPTPPPPMPEPVSMPAPPAPSSASGHVDSDAVSQSTKISFGRFSRLSRKKSSQTTRTTRTNRTSTSSFQSPGSPAYSETESAHNAYPYPYRSNTHSHPDSRRQSRDEDDESLYADEEDRDEDPFHRQVPAPKVYGGRPAFKSSNSAL